MRAIACKHTPHKTHTRKLQASDAGPVSARAKTRLKEPHIQKHAHTISQPAIPPVSTPTRYQKHARGVAPYTARAPPPTAPAPAHQRCTRATAQLSTESLSRRSPNHPCGLHRRGARRTVSRNAGTNPRTHPRMPPPHTRTSTSICPPRGRHTQHTIANRGHRRHVTRAASRPNTRRIGCPLP